MPAEVVKPSLTLIAKKCGVSKMTVSRVLRNEPNVSLSTRKLVLRVAEKAGFLPSGAHRTSRDKAVGDYCTLFQPEYSKRDAFFSGIILGVQQELFERGFGCAVGVIRNEYAEFLKLNRILCSRHVRGVLVVGEIPAQYAATLQANLRDVVFIDYPGDSGLGSPYNAVCVDNVYGGRLALSHLLKLGRKRILLICGKAGHYFSNDLLTAYRESLAEHNLEFDPHLVINADFHINGGLKAVKGALDAGLRFDAIFSNDEMACGAIKALELAGLKVPRDVSVVGFDGLPIGEIVNPALTTVVVDREKMGRLAVRRLLSLDGETGDDEKFEKVSIFPRLLVRESCGAPMEASA
jgi:DNA-binding LacI/PurR family transcriptional regulator